MSPTNAITEPAESESVSFAPSLDSFKRSVIDKFQIRAGSKLCSYKDYLEIPIDSDIRRGDEANAVDQQFTQYTLEWLGFNKPDWRYNQPESSSTGKNLNRPDYTVYGSVGIAFIVEDKNSTLDFDIQEHLKQMQRYCTGTAGYAVWCNMRRILAIRFLPTDILKYEVLADISIEGLFGTQPLLPDEAEASVTNLALFQLLFGKDRFTKFDRLIENIIIVKEEEFEQKATPLDTTQSIQNFINDSLQSLNHLKLAALSQIKEALGRRKNILDEEAILLQEWKDAFGTLVGWINAPIISDPVIRAVEKLTPRLGELEPNEIQNVGNILKEAYISTSGLKTRVLATIMLSYENWQERALRINSALLTQHFETTTFSKTANAYRVWSERQSDEEDIKPEIFAEQVAYVFFVRILLIRVLEDKHIFTPRIASDGGLLDWNNYISSHFKELIGVSILNETFYNILSRKAGSYYLHFFQQAVFDWFNPDDFLLVETLEFLSRYNFRTINSDIIGFTYEAYIERNARDRKGHFLTRQEVVEYMLDMLGYAGPQIIERSILDPACGSGSFLVHAARRYRQALVTFFCQTRGLQGGEQTIQSDAKLRKEFARNYLNDITSYFFGMELNPFACYLAEMNLLIQALDDLFILQQPEEEAKEEQQQEQEQQQKENLRTIEQPLERFRIYNTDSLDLPREVLDRVDLTGEISKISVPDRLSDRLADEAYPIKAAIEPYDGGFFYIISNPPYVSSKQEDLDTRRFRDADFFKSVLSGDMNLYLLFLRLGLHYLADYGRMIYIVPLTIFGDQSARAARQLLKTPPFDPSVTIRFYRGDILFPGVDQAVAIVRIDHSSSDAMVTVSGGNTVQEARSAQFSVPRIEVVDATLQSDPWNGSWLVAPNRASLEIWQHVKRVSNNLTLSLDNLLDITFDRKQGDVNATYLNPFRRGANQGGFAEGDIAIYKGEDVKSYAPLPSIPSDWARPEQKKILSQENLRTLQVLEKLKETAGIERGIVLREVARLNTRERLIATWFERDKDKAIAFTHELWRILLNNSSTEEYGKALLAVINSNTTAYLINLFSTNNHVGKDELGRVPIPDPQHMPVAQLAKLANEMLKERSRLNQEYLSKYQAKLPVFDDETMYIPPSTFLATTTRIPKITMAGLVGQGKVKNYGRANGKIKSLRTKNLIVSTIDSTDPNGSTLTEILNLFLNEPKREDASWSEAQNWQLPDPVAADNWLNAYYDICAQAQKSWSTFISLQRQIDDIVADWYGFSTEQRLAIKEGLPWTRRIRDDSAQEPAEEVQTPTSTNLLDIAKRIPITSNLIGAYRYDPDTGTLEIEFLSGEVWQYQSVPPEVWQNFEAASSKGRYYLREIKGKYDAKKV